jgi:hypothetical protein
MRVMVVLVAVLALSTSVGCKKAQQAAGVDVAAAATVPLTTAAAGAATCPACPPASACPVCAACPAPDELSKVELGAEPATLKVYPPAGFSFTVAKAGEYRIDATSSLNDPVLHLYKGDESLGSDDDSGGETNARLYVFLEPGDYVARVGETSWKPLEAKVKVAAAAPMTPVGALKVGESLDVEVPEGTPDVRACQEATFEVATAGKYRLDATSGEDFDPIMTLIRDGVVVDENDDFESGGNRAARIERDFEPATYTVRVCDVQARAATIKVAAAAVTE